MSGGYAMSELTSYTSTYVDPLFAAKDTINWFAGINLYELNQITLDQWEDTDNDL